MWGLQHLEHSKALAVFGAKAGLVQKVQHGGAAAETEASLPAGDVGLFEAGDYLSEAVFRGQRLDGQTAGYGITVDAFPFPGGIGGDHAVEFPVCRGEKDGFGFFCAVNHCRGQHLNVNAVSQNMAIIQLTVHNGQFVS